jgi:hypothetical protein
VSRRQPDGCLVLVIAVPLIALAAWAWLLATGAIQ